MSKYDPLCPICESNTVIFDVVDFNKSCGDLTARSAGLSGVPIYYNLCEMCGFLFAPEIHRWSRQDFIERIYNSDYINYDGDYVEKRPLESAKVVEQLFGRQKRIIKHLDYGGGNGKLSQLLLDSGWRSSSYDPFSGKNVNLDGLGKFNLITAFEVFEHAPDVQNLMSRMSCLSDPDAAILISTLLNDNHINRNERLSWWYAAPRNGHISLFSKRSLSLLAKMHGLKVQHLNENLHLIRHDPTIATT